MQGILREEFYRAFRNRRFWMVFILAWACFGLGYLRRPVFPSSLGDEITLSTVWTEILPYGGFQYLAAFMAALPFADSLLADRNQGYIRQVVLRCRYWRYILAKILANASAGAVGLALPLLTLFAAIQLVSLFDGRQAVEQLASFRSALDLDGPLFDAFVIVFLAAAFGAVYATLSLSISTVIHHPAIILAAPFTTLVVISFVAERSVRFRALGHPLTALLPFTVYPSASDAPYTASLEQMVGYNLSFK